MWQLHQIAKTYSQRPSSILLDPDDARERPWLAYQIDSAVWMFGTWIDGKLAERTEPVKTGKNKGQTKPKYTLAELLADPVERSRVRRPYRSAGALAQIAATARTAREAGEGE